MARKPLRPLIRSGGFYPSRKWTPLVYAGGYTTANGGEEPAPPPIEKTVTGNPIHILDALAKPAQALSVKLEPIQDLYGYANPWPSGGGVNKLPSTPSMDTTVNDVRFTSDGNGKYTIVGTASGSNTLVDCAFDAPITLPSSDIYVHLMNNEASANANLFFFNGTTQVAGITFGAVNRIYKLTNLTGATIDKIRIIVGNGETVNITCTPMLCLDNVAKNFSSYSNICPISGHTDADVTSTGKNLFDVSRVHAFNGNVTLTKNGGSWTVENNNTYSVDAFFESVGKTVTFELKDGQYTISISEAISRAIPVYYSNDGVTWAWLNNGIPLGYTSATFTVSGQKYIQFRCSVQANSTIAIKDFMLELGSTATDYEEYRGTTYPIPLGQTVYGGQLDVLTGVLTVDGVKEKKRWGAGQYQTVIGTVARKEISLSSVAVYPPTTGKPQLSSIAPYKAAYFEDSVHFYVNANSTNQLIMFLPVGTSDDTEFEVSYELATPQTIQLTAQQVELLQGENNLFSDGEMTLVYLADGNASDVEALNILLGGRYVNNHGEDEPTDREALDILLGRTR